MKPGRARTTDSRGRSAVRQTDCSMPSEPSTLTVQGDARQTGLADSSVDLVATSPPYWRKRDYGVVGQIGQEADAADFVQALVECLREWRRVLRPTGSVFLNIGDTYHRRSLAGIPGRLEAA